MTPSNLSYEAPPALEIAALKTVGPARAVAVILAASVAVFLFLFWLVYFKGGDGPSSGLLAALPAVNAALNALSATFLVAGFVAIRQRRYARHSRLMFAALVTSALFLVSYVVYHNTHGDTKFTGTGPVRPIYFFILISHIVLSAAAVPLVLLSFYLSLAGRLAAHRRVSRFTFPVWLYVSVTGVLVFAMLKLFSTGPAAPAGAG